MTRDTLVSLPPIIYMAGMGLCAVGGSAWGVILWLRDDEGDWADAIEAVLVGAVIGGAYGMLWPFAVPCWLLWQVKKRVRPSVRVPSGDLRKAGS